MSNGLTSLLFCGGDHELSAGESLIGSFPTLEEERKYLLARVTVLERKWQ